MKRYISFLVLSSLIGVAVIQATGQRRFAAVSPLPFEPQEELYYTAEFSRSLLRNLDVAEFKLRATRTTPRTKSDSPSEQKPIDTLILSADVSSRGFFTRLFNLKFREQVESTVDPNSFSILKTTILDEQGKRVRTTETLFDQAKGKMTWTSRDPNNPSSEPRTSVTDFSGQLQDILSAIYFIRTQPLEVGKSFDVFIGDGGRIYKVPVKVVEKKKMKTLLGKLDVVRVEPDLFGPDKMIDEEKGSFTLWITSDSRRIPVNCRIKTDYGTFDIKLKRVSPRPV